MKASEILVLNKIGTKKQVKKLIKNHKVYLDTEVLEEDREIEEGQLYFEGKKVDMHPLKYIMLHKPLGYLSANQDNQGKTIMELLPYKDLSMVGRLDRETSGLMLLTNDKKLRKKLILPEFHIERSYEFTCRNPLDSQDLEQFHSGIIIDGDVRCESTLPKLLSSTKGMITLHEGKYHEIRKMFMSLDNEIVTLHRISYGGVTLDIDVGEYRHLSQEEIERLKEAVS